MAPAAYGPPEDGRETRLKTSFSIRPPEPKVAKLDSLTSITQIIRFVRIAQTGSISEAARQLNVSASTVSKGLSQLEDTLGVLLIKRTTRQLALTDQGQSFLEKSMILLQDIEHAVNEVSQFRQEYEGKLKITTSVAFGLARMNETLRRYRKRYPHVLTYMSIEDGHIDLGAYDTDIALKITSSTHWTYAARKLSRIRWAYCASPDYLAEHGHPNRPSELVRHRCLIYPKMTMDGAWAFLRNDNIEKAPVMPSLVSNSSSILIDAALASQGIACLPIYLAADSLVSGKLQIVLPAYRCAHEHILYAMYFQNRYSNPLVRSMVEFLVEEFGSEPPWERAVDGLV